MNRIALPRLALCDALMLRRCTQEQQKKAARDIQNRTGTNGVLDESLNFIAGPGAKQV